jgi:DNA polymerase-3 subunit alpha
MSFVHLHNHTSFSLLDGAIAIDKLLAAAKNMGMEAVAVTDHGNMFAAINFYQEAHKYGVKPILGCELYVAPESRFDKIEYAGLSRYYHLILLAADLTGYRNLVRLVSAGYTEGFYYRPRIDLELLSKNHEGLIALSACIQGQIPQLLLAGKDDKALAAAEKLSLIMGKDNLFIEMQDLGLPEHKKLNPLLMELAGKLGLPLVATNDCHFLNREDFEAQDALVAIQTGRVMTDPGRLQLPTEAFFKSPAEMEALFAFCPEALRNTVRIAERCRVELRFGQLRFPKMILPPGREAEKVLEENAGEGLKKRLAEISGYDFDEAGYRERLERELAILKQMGFADYFLVVADFINWAKEHGIPVGPGRGSAAGSLVAWAMRITDLDPIRYGLIFERFLNVERKSMPDIDVDFCAIRRNEVIEYVSRRYGKEKVAQIITFGSMKARAAVRDVGRVLGMPYGEVDAIAKIIPETLGISLDDAIKMEPRLKERMQADPQVQKLLAIARTLEGMPRHASVHAAGVVIGDAPLEEIVPLYKAVDKKGSEDVIITQFDMKCLEKAGLIKFDFLGLNTLTEIDTAVKLIRKGHDPEFAIENIPLDDPASYALLCRGDSVGVFQVESSGMKSLLTKMRPSCLEDIIALIALYRPGPLESGMVDDFVACKHGRKKVSYFMPQLEPILKDTYGVMVYQEQVLEIARVIAGYTLGAADNLRRAMGKKDPQVMAAERSRFMEGAAAKGINPAQAGQLFDLIEKFAGYGFNKSHSAAYAVIAYQTAYLKANYPYEFMAAVLTCRSDRQEAVMKLIAECQMQQLKILPPDVNYSDREFTVQGKTIRFGLKAVKNVGEGSIEAIVAARAQKGEFKSIFDFCARADPGKINRKVLESLIKCGAFDSCSPNRAALLAIVEDALEYGQRVKKEQDGGQINMFASAGYSGIPEPLLPSLPPWPEKDMLAFEKETLGFYITAHPLNRFAREISRLGVKTIDSLDSLPDRAKVRLAGVPLRLKEIFTKKGERMARLTLEDLTGQISLTVFPKSFSASAACLNSEEPVIIEGTLERDEREGQVTVDRVLPLEEAGSHLANSLRLSMSAPEVNPALLTSLRRILTAHPGSCRVVLNIALTRKGEVVLNLPGAYRVEASAALLAAVEELGMNLETVLN